MNVSRQSFKVSIALVATCLAWIAALSMVAVFFAGTAISTGWIIAGVLLLALIVALVGMFREVRRATELPDYFSQIAPAVDEKTRVFSCRQRFRSSVTPLTGRRGMTAGGHYRIMPRKVTARQSRPRTQNWS